MHSYSIDSNERFTVICLLAFMGIIVAYLISQLDHIGVAAPWWLDAPAAFGSASLLYFLFDRWVWKMPILRAIGLIQTPDLSGDWEGYVQSSHDKHETKHPAKIHIKQRWTTLALVLATANSRSESRIAGIETKGDGSPELTHTYLNKPRGGAVATMETHEGTSTMRLSNDGVVLDGDYYSGRGRQTEGRLQFRRII